MVAMETSYFISGYILTIIGRPVARIFRRGVAGVCCMHVCMQKHAIVVGLGTSCPRKFLENRCSEVASEAIWGQKQNCSSLHGSQGIAVFSCPYIFICQVR